MGYTHQQRAAFKDAYARRLRKQIVMIVLLFVAMTALALTEGATFFGVSDEVFGPIAFVAVVVGWMIFAGRNWRCPACDKHLGRAFNPRHCRTCGMELRG